MKAAKIKRKKINLADTEELELLKGFKNCYFDQNKMYLCNKTSKY